MLPEIKVLVLYATRQGQTRKIAQAIASHLQAAGANVDVVDAAHEDLVATLDLQKYQRLVFGASMHAGGLEKELVDWLNQHKVSVETRPRFLFVVTLSAATKDAALREQWLADAHKKIQSQLTVNFAQVDMFAGALTYSRYSLPVRWLMRRIAQQAGGDTDTHKDYEYTDWDEVERFANKVLHG